MGRNRTSEIVLDPPEPDADELPARPPRARGRPASAWRRRARLLLRAAPWVAAAAAGVWGWARLVRFLQEDPRFRLPATEWEAVQALEIRGLRSLPRHEVLEIFRPDLGRSIYLVPLGERRRRLLAIDWVAEATVARRWPNRLEIRIRERRPVAFILEGEALSGGAGNPALIDAEGVLLRRPTQGNFSLPVLWGVSASQPRAERRGRVRLMLDLLEQAGPPASRISEVDVRDPRNVIVTLALGDRAARLYLGRENFAARLKAFLDYHAQILRWVPEARTFDLRVDGQVRVADPPPSHSGQTASNAKGEQVGRQDHLGSGSGRGQ